MTRQHASGYTPAADPYVSHRCPLCRHIRYADEQPGDPCRLCPCRNHVTPSEDGFDGLCLSVLQNAGHLDHGGHRWRHTDPYVVRCNCGERVEIPQEAPDAAS